MADDKSNTEVAAMESADLINWMGTDAGKWTQAFLVHTDLANAGPDFYSTVHGWFANAIEWGKTAGMTSAIEEMQHAATNLKVDLRGIYVPGGCIELAYHTGFTRGEQRATDRIAEGD